MASGSPRNAEQTPAPRREGESRAHRRRGPICFRRAGPRCERRGDRVSRAGVRHRHRLSTVPPRRTPSSTPSSRSTSTAWRPWPSMRSTLPTAWDGLLEYLTHVVALPGDRPRPVRHRRHPPAHEPARRTRARAPSPHVQRLIERAQEAGSLRPDVVYEDISVLLWTTGRVVDATREVARLLAAIPRATGRRAPLRVGNASPPAAAQRCQAPPRDAALHEVASPRP